MGVTKSLIKAIIEFIIPIPILIPISVVGIVHKSERTRNPGPGGSDAREVN